MSTLPHPSAGLIESLQGIRRKVKLFSAAFGAGIVLAAAVGLLLLTVLLDWTLNLPTFPRVVVVLLALAALVYAAWRYIAQPLLARLTIGDVAGRVEHAFPQFDDRLRSTVNFTGQEIPGSEPMKQKVLDETAKLAQGVDLNRVLVLKPVWYAAGGGAAAVVVLIGVSMLAGRNFVGIAANRLAGGDAKYPKSVQIDMVGDLPTRVPVGSAVPVKIKLAKGAGRTKKAVIHYRYDNGPWQKELMTLGEEGTFTASLDSKIRPDEQTGRLQVRVQAGDDEKALSPITMVPRLDVNRIEARITPPPYAGPAITTVPLGERPASMATGSEVQLHVTFNKPLDKGQAVSLAPVKPEQKAPEIAWDRSADTLAVGRFKAGESIRFTVRATDTDGFQNTGTQEYELVVREDGMPTVQIEEPRRSEDRTPQAQVPLKVVAEDDYGISQAQLVVTRLGEKTAPAPAGADANSLAKNSWVIDLVSGETFALNVGWTPVDDRSERKRFRLDYAWDLGQLENANLKPGDVLEYFVQVKDNFKLDGREHDFVPSGKLRLTIISQEQFQKQVQNALEQIHNEVSQIKRGQTGNKTETEALAAQTKDSQKFDEADQKQAERLANQQATAAAQTKQTAGKLSDLVERMKQNKSPEGGMKETATQVGKDLERTAEGAMKDANKELNAAKDQKSDPKASAEQKQQQAEQRDAALAKAQQNQQQAAEQLQQAMEKLGNFGGLSEAIARIEEIKKAQDKVAKEFNEKMKDQLGKKADELDQKTKDELQKMVDEQKKLQQQTEQALADMAKKGDQMQKSDPASAQAMKQAALTGQQQGVPSKQQQSAQSMQQNQQAQAQQAQKQVEVGLEMILNKLKEAERRKLEELAKQLEEMQKLLADLIRRQAGHNLDNLALDNPKKLTDMTEEARDDLLARAERDAANLPAPPALPQLSASQEQTERNTRDVAKTAEALPDSAPAAKLVAAAGQMERAIVHLRNNKLPDAYDPPQIEALRALVEAKVLVDVALEKAREQLEQRDQETIRQAYVKLLEAQKKLNAGTIEIDATPRDPAGGLPRQAMVRLGQMPGEQGALATKAEGLGADLQKVGSIVYVWANKDIVRSMNEVKADLAKPETGKPTQAEQLRIAEQLQSMIDNLAEKKKKPKFAQRGGGGGECKGGAKMPTEAELRLLKGLQQAVNKSTQTIDAEKQAEARKAADEARKQAEAQKLLALGGRQGDLRNLLDQLMQAASEGKVKLGNEPDNKDQLPEEASKEDVEDQEFLKGLIDDEKMGEDTVDKSVKLTGDRMARSRQRLALNNDPGKTTQTIQERIVMDLDNLIELARQQQQQSQQQARNQKPGDKKKQQQPGKKPGQQEIASKPNQGKKPGQQTGGNNPAEQSTLSEGGREEDLSRDIQQKDAEWGGITQRQREAVMEGASEQVIEKYKNLVDDYYRELAKKARTQP